MTIGLLCGSVNPAHAGHLMISQTALQRLGLDRLWWLVSPGNPLKNNRTLPPLSKRLAQARSLARHPKIEVTGFEAALPDPYTKTTIAHLKARYPGVRFVWIMGADSLIGFHRWRGWRGLFAALPFAVLDRPGYRYRAMAGRAARAFDHARLDESDAAGLANHDAPAWMFLSGPVSAQSSSAIRSKKAR